MHQTSPCWATLFSTPIIQSAALFSSSLAPYSISSLCSITTAPPPPPLFVCLFNISAKER